MKKSLIAMLISVVTYFEYACAKDLPKNPPITQKVYFDLNVGSGLVGRIVIGLFGTVAPKTAYNFYSLATSDNPHQGYLNTTIDTIFPEFLMQGGNFTTTNGTSGVSIYPGEFKPENFDLLHDRPYRVAMLKSDKGLIGSQFFITMTETPFLDGDYVVFGEVVEGTEVLKMLQFFGSKDGKPLTDIRVVAAGDMHSYQKCISQGSEK